MLNEYHNKIISTQALIALKEALANIYWRKQDIRKFIELTIKNNTIVSTIDWESNVKFESVSILVDRMVARKDIYFEDLLFLIYEVSNFNDFSHLRKWEDGEKKIDRAQSSVAALRSKAKGYFDQIDELKKAEIRKVDNQVKIRQTISFSQKLNSLKEEFLLIASNPNAQKRGYDFEKLLINLFILFDLDPKSSFKIIGEQIDGAFTFENQEYLLEAKWQKEQVPASTLYEFGGKIAGKLKTTLGLFVSLDGYTKECLNAQSPILKSMILFDGQDIVMILDGRITLTDMLYLKKRHASQTGDIFYRITGV